MKYIVILEWKQFSYEIDFRQQNLLLKQASILLRRVANGINNNDNNIGTQADGRRRGQWGHTNLRPNGK